MKFIHSILAMETHLDLEYPSNSCQQCHFPNQLYSSSLKTSQTDLYQIDYYLFIGCLSVLFPLSPPTIKKINTQDSEEFRFRAGTAENRIRISIDDTHKLRWKRVEEIRS